MPREIKTTIAVDGEAAFKRAINEANTSMRNLGTQLTLAQAQFKKDGDAMKLMETRSKALKSEIDQQEKIVTALEKAVKDSADAFGENSDKTEKWEAELNRAKAKLVNLQSELTLNDAGLDRNGQSFDSSSQKAADYQATLETIGKNVSFQSVTEGISGITSKIESAIKKVWNFAKSLKDAMVDSGKWADDLVTDATTHGFTIEEEQRWQYASKFVDTEVDTIFNARNKLTAKIKGWKDSYSDDVWETLGIKLTGDDGIVKDKMDLMWELGETLLHVGEDYERGTTKIDPEVLSMEAFGKSWRDLLPLFKAGREAFEGYLAEAPVVADESVLALNESHDAVEKLESQWDVLQKSFFAEMAPTMTEVTTALSEMLKEFNEWMKTEEGKEAMKGLSDSLKELFSGLKDIKFSDAINTAKDAVNALKDGLEWLTGHKDDVYNGLKVIAAGFGLLKVVEIAANIGRIVSGLQTLGLVGSGKGTGNGTPTTAPTTGTDTTGTDTTTTTTGGIGSALLGGKNALNGKLLDLSSWANAFNLTNAGFVSDWFFHNTETGRSINPEYGNSFSFENLWNGFWRSVNNKIEENGKAQEAYESGETWSILDPASKERYDKKQAQNAFEEAAREYHAEHTEPTLTVEEWEAMSRLERDLYMKLHPMPTQEEMNQEYLSGTTYWNAAPGSETATSAEDRAEQTAYEVLKGVGDELNDAQRTAAEAWWDAFREDPLSDASDEKWDALEEAFAGNDELLERFSDAVDNWFTDYEDQSYMNQEDLLSDAVAEMRVNTESGRSIADKIASADFKRFNSLPAEIQTAAQKGTASGVSGIQVRLDGYTVGRLVAPYVSSYIASHAM